MQYDARLAAIYAERGVPQCPWNTSHLTGYDSAGYHSFVHVTEAILAAEQGVKCQYLSHGIGMNLLQDIAMIRVSERLCYEYCFTPRLPGNGFHRWCVSFSRSLAAT